MFIICIKKTFSYILKSFFEGGFFMARRNSKMSENLKMEIAKELGVYDQVKKDGGWENVSSKTCGNIVSKAIEIANKAVE